jgi:NAD(P)H-nitrite reductase large subunit
MYQLTTDSTVVCRCEEVTAEQIKAVAIQWKGSLRAIKQCTRAGMGQCQGRICESNVARIASEISGLSLEEIGCDTPRPHIKPVSLNALSAAVQS